MPGLLTTTSADVRAATPPSASPATGVPSGMVPGAWSTSAGLTPSARSRRTLAWPSTPTPQTATRRPERSDHDVGAGIRGLDEVRPERAQQRRDVGQGP